MLVCLNDPRSLCHTVHTPGRLAEGILSRWRWKGRTFNWTFTVCDVYYFLRIPPLLPAPVPFYGVFIERSPPSLEGRKFFLYSVCIFWSEGIVALNICFWSPQWPKYSSNEKRTVLLQRLVQLVCILISLKSIVLVNTPSPLPPPPLFFFLAIYLIRFPHHLKLYHCIIFFSIILFLHCLLRTIKTYVVIKTVLGYFSVMCRELGTAVLGR